MKHIFSALMLLFFGGINAQTTITDPRPDVVILYIDDAGLGDFGFSGGTHANTPVIDSLSKLGVNFLRHYTHPGCSPSRTSLLTGMHTFRQNLKQAFFFLPLDCTKYAGDIQGLDGNRQSIAKSLKSVGYNTAMFGKWHLGETEGMLPHNHGFETWRGTEFGEADHISKVENCGKTYDTQYYNGVYSDNNPVDSAHSTTAYTNYSIDYMNNYSNYVSDDTKPFFLYLPYLAVHDPYQSKTDTAFRFEGGLGQNQGTDWNTNGFTPPNYEATYIKMLEELDEEILRVVSALPRPDNTIVVFSSDNGAEEGQNYAGVVGDWHNNGLNGQKGETYQGGIRVPTFIYWRKNIQANKEFNGISTVEDMFPTIADLVGAPSRPFLYSDTTSFGSGFDEDSRGRSLVRYLYNSQELTDYTEGRKFYTQSGGRWGLVDSCYKLVRVGVDRFIFDICNDPNETIDIGSTNVPLRTAMNNDWLNWHADNPD